jgi:DNA-binding CsgD family transcriptional regulator
MLAIVLETLIDAVMIVNADGVMIQANRKATKLCGQLTQHHSSTQNAMRSTTVSPRGEQHRRYTIPGMMQPLLAALLESYTLFPEQQILPEFELHLADGTPLRVRGQFLDMPQSDADLPYILITIENRQESLHSVAIGEAQRFGFTQRETEVWYLRLIGRSYREISRQLYITENTVRKHVKSVLAKRRVELEALA